MIHFDPMTMVTVVPDVQSPAATRRSHAFAKSLPDAASVTGIIALIEINVKLLDPEYRKPAGLNKRICSFRYTDHTTWHVQYTEQPVWYTEIRKGKGEYPNK